MPGRTHPHEADRGHELEASIHGRADDVVAELNRLRAEVQRLREEQRSHQASPAAATRSGSRRDLLGFAGASAFGVMAGSLAQGRSVSAADPNDVVKNTSNAVTGTTTLDGTIDGPTFSVFNRSIDEPGTALYASADAASPAVRADNSATAGLGGVGFAGNAPGGRDLLAFGSGRIAMNDHTFGNAEAYSAGEIHQSGGTLYAMVTPTARRELAGPASAGAFHVVTPTRVYDSRRPQPAFGRIDPNTSRVVAVADVRSTATGAVTVPDLVPPGATAIAFTVTVDRTAARGHLYVSPAFETQLLASTINWWGDGMILANSSIVGVSGDRRIRVHCGPVGSTDFIIDVTGYYA